MATALQKQLAVIAAASTHQLDLKAQRSAHSKSLLFEPRVAAAQNFDTLYPICLEGFRELCSLDRRFMAFSKTIFSEQSRVEERGEMTAKDNDGLNVIIEGFLGLVGSRLLLKPAIKAVEWLIRRFRIHEYNTELTILTFLPYHETPIFKTLLSILPPVSKIPQTLRFLAPYQTKLANPPRSAIMYAAMNNTSFLVALNTYVLRIVRAHQQSASLLSFWASVITQAINSMMGTSRPTRTAIKRKREEDVLLLFLPVLNEGLTFHHAPEMVIACYMTIMVLVAKAVLEEKVLDGLMEAVVKSGKTDTENSCLVCLAVIAQERRRMRFPKSVAKRLLKFRGLPEKLPELAKQCRVERFALGYMLSRLDRADANEVSSLQDVDKVLHFHLIDENLNAIAIGAIIQYSQKISSSGAMDNIVRQHLTSTISRIASSQALSPSWELALQNEKVDLESLEMQLGTVLQDMSEKDVDLTASASPSDDQTNAISSLDAVLSSLQEKVNESAPKASFFNPDMDSLFREISRAFALATRSPSRKENLATALALPVLRRNQPFKYPNYFSCLLRLGVSSPSAMVRTSAWQSLQETLSGRATDAKSAQGLKIADMQIIFPYLITGLSDSAIAVRRPVAKCIIALKSLNKLRKVNGSEQQPWGRSDFYGADMDNLHWLSLDESAKIISSLFAPYLEECILDASLIQQLLEAALGGRPKGTNSERQDELIELKSSLRTSFATLLASHATKSPHLAVRLPIFTILGRIGKSGSKARVQYLLPAIRLWFGLDKETASELCRLESLAITNVDRAYLSAVHPRDFDSVSFLLDVIGGKLNPNERNFSAAAVDRLMQIWPNLKGKLGEHVAKSLLDIALEEPKEDASTSSQENALGILRSVELSTDMLDIFLRSVPTVAQLPDAPSPSKRRRTSQVERMRLENTDPAEYSNSLIRLTLILELVDSSSPENHPALLKGLFNMLGELQHHRTRSGSGLVYLQSLVIGSLLSIVKVQSNSRDSTVEPDVIRVDLLVDCIRHSSSPQVQNSALLLVSHLASWQPELVLHSVMPIFTYIGSTLLRQSDDYSVHVIDQTASRVVPPLAASLRRKNQNFVLGISDLLLSFVAAYEHIPLHRRLNLFSQLLKTLGPEGSLAAASALLFDRYPTELSLPRFFSDLMKQFDPVVILKSYKQYLELLEDGLRPRRQLTDTLFGFKEKNAKEVEASLINLLKGLVTMLHDNHLRSRLSRVLSEDESKATLIRRHFTQVVENVIVLSNQVKPREALHQACRNVLLATLDLLPSIELVKSSEALLESPHGQVRRAALQAIQLRIKSARQIDENAIRALLSFLPRIVALIRNSDDTALRQVAIACVDLISELYGKKDIAIVADAAGVIATSDCLSNKDEQLKVMSLHCLANMVEVLQEEFIQLLPGVLPQAFSLLEASIFSLLHDALHNAAYALICAVVEHIPFIFSGQYFTKALELAYQSAAANLPASSDESRLHFYALSAKLMDPKQLFTSMEQTWNAALQAGPKALDEYVELLNMAVKKCSKASIAGNTLILFNIVLQIFDFRRTRHIENLEQQYTDEYVKHIEERITESVIAMVLKLNDATFRPLFVKLAQWTSKSLPKSDASSRNLRAISFYRFLCAFFERLKSLVTSYSSYTLDQTVNLMKTTTTKDPNDRLLFELVLQALTKSFEYDKDDFWQSPSHFAAVSEPLAAQLANESNSMVNEFVIPAITGLASAASSGDHHKSLNAMIMKHMRAHEAHARLAAIKCEQSLTERLGEEWLGLLPEMLPYISELQDDDDEIVEREVRRWIKRIEEILGESLDTMLQ